MNRKLKGFLTLFGLFWSALTLLFDGVTFVPAVRQIVAGNYTTTEGTIVSSGVTQTEDSDGGPTHGISVRYTYVVNDREYNGTRYRYDNSSSSDSKWAYDFVAAHPAGKKVKVYFHPANPTDSVLATGLEGSDLFHLAFMTPFNAVMFGFWYAGWRQIHARLSRPRIAGGVKMIRGLKETRIRLAFWPPLATGIGTSTLLAFLSIFIVGFGAGGWHPPMRTMVLAWSIIIAGGTAAGLIHWLQAVSGRYDLVIDEMNSTLELPATQGRKIRKRVPYKNIQTVTVQIVQQPSSDGESSPMYAPTLTTTGPNPASERLAQWLDRQRANDFAAWLSKKVGMKAAPAQDTDS